MVYLEIFSGFWVFGLHQFPWTRSRLGLFSFVVWLWPRHSPGGGKETPWGSKLSVDSITLRSVPFLVNTFMKSALGFYVFGSRGKDNGTERLPY